MSSPTEHYLRWTLSPGGMLRSVAVCTAGPEARCRWQAECDCEVWYGLGIDDQGPYHWAEGGPPDLDDPDAVEDWLDEKHRMTYGGPCNVALHLNEESEHAEAYGGDRDLLLATTAFTPHWADDHYEWHPVAP